MWAAKLGVDHGTNRLIHIGNRESLERLHRPGANKLKFGKAALVNQHHPLAHSTVFFGSKSLPARLKEIKLVYRLNAFRGKPKRPLPAVFAAHYRTVFNEPRMQW